MEANWLIDIFRDIFLWVDSIIYKFIDWVYQLFMLISETGVFKSQDIREFANRIYFFLGLIMIFKVSISIVQYIVNPDSIKAKETGASKLLANIAFVLVGIVLVPYVFDAAYGIQRIVLKDNVIGNLILGKSFAEKKTDEDYIENAGKNMAFTTLSAFFRLDNTIVTDDSGDQPLFNAKCLAQPFADMDIINPECGDAADNAIRDFINDKSRNQNYTAAYMYGDINYLTKIDHNYTIEDKNGDDIYMFDYSIIISSLAGGFVVWILLGFCIDIAIRNVKLGFLQLIAPIPLIAKIDPKTGQKAFDAWVKECKNTYLSLFGRLVAIYFVIYLLSLISTQTVNIVDGGEGTDNLFVKVFFILGALQFAKSLPNLMSTLLPGFKMGDGKLGLKSKIAATPLVGGALNKALGLAGRTAKNAAFAFGNAALFGASKAFGKTKAGRNHAQRVADGTDLRTKLLIAKKNVGNKIGKATDKLDEITGNRVGNIGNDVRTTFNGMGASLKNQLGLLENKKNQILNRQSAGKIEKEQNKKLADTISAMENRASERIKNGAAGDLSMRYNTEKTRIEMMKNMTSTEWNRPDNSFSYDENGQSVSQEEAVAKAQYALDNWMNSNEKDGAISQYIDSVVNHKYTDSNGQVVDVASSTDANGKIHYSWSDGTMENGLYANYCAQSEANNQEVKTDGHSMHSVLASMKTRNNEIDREQMEGNNQIAKIDDQIRAAQDFKSKK